MKKSKLSEATNSAMNFTRYVTTTWDSRLVGSEACLDCGDYIYDTLAAFCDSVNKQEFNIHPASFLGQFRINVILYFFSLILLFLKFYGFAIIPISVAIIISVFQFFFYRELLDPFFPKKKGKNIYGIIEPTDQVKQQIIFSAHHDSAHIFNHYQNNPERFDIKILMAAATQISMFIFCWLLFIINFFEIPLGIFHWIAVVLLSIASISLHTYWTLYDRKNGTPGAGDNMACLAIAIEVGKYFSEQKKQNNGLKNTRIVVGSWDGEEAGLRGSRAFVKQHKNDFLKVKTYNFNLECMFDHQSLHFLTSDLNGFVKLSEDMSEECVAIANQLGYNCDSKPFRLLAGGTDAAEFAKSGIEATTLVAMKWQNKDYKSFAYHTLRDTIDAVDSTAVHHSIDIGINYVIGKDKRSD